MDRNLQAQIREDYQTVHQAETAQFEVADKIINYQATTDEIRNWYFAQDPLGQSDYESISESIANISLDPNEYLKWLYEQDRNQRIMTSAAVGLTVATLMPSFYQANPGIWFEQLVNEASDDILGDVESLESVIINHAVNNAEQVNLTQDQLDNLRFAVEILNHTKEIGFVDIATLVNSGASFKTVQDYMISNPVSQRMLDETGALISLNAEFTFRAIRNAEQGIEAKLYLLQSLPLQVSSLINIYQSPAQDLLRDSDESKYAYRKDLIIFYIELIDAIATGQDKVQNIGKSVKGSLHEAIWFLDCLMLREIYKSDYFIDPARSSQDRPKIGYPELNRAFDFVITSPGKAETYVQLKSTPPNPNKQNVAVYHPQIDIAAEQNFMDMHEKSLKMKLSIYLELINADFADSELIEKVMKKILPSALDVHKKVVDRVNINNQEHLQIMNNFGIHTFDQLPDYDKRIEEYAQSGTDPGFNRAHRRQLEKVHKRPANQLVNQTKSKRKKRKKRK